MLEENLANPFCLLTIGLMGLFGLSNLSSLLMLELLHSDLKFSCIFFPDKPFIYIY